MKKKGFTLVELIAVIVILGIIIALVAPSLIDTTDKSKKKALETKILDIELAASNWAMSFDANIAWISETCIVTGSSGKEDIPCDKTTVTVQQLLDSNFYQADKDGLVSNPITKEAMNNKSISIKKYLGSYYGDYQE